MAKRLTLQDGGKSLTFIIRKLPATQAEAWYLHALALMGSGMESATQFSPMLFLKALGSIPFADAKALLDELLGCCEKVVDKGSSIPVSIEDADGYISSPVTLTRLRVEAFKENFGFFTDGDIAVSLGLVSSEPTAQKSEA